MFEFALRIQVIVAMECLSLLFGRSRLPDPRHHDILRVALVPTSSAGLLFKSPSIDQDFAAWLPLRTASHGSQNLGDSLDPPSRGGEMMHDGDRDCKVKKPIPMWEVHDISHDRGMRLVLDCNPNQVFRSARLGQFPGEMDGERLLDEVSC